MWVTIPEDFIVLAPFLKKVFPDGKYISVPSYRLDLGENYQMLYDYASDCNEYELDLQQNNMRHELEEYIDFRSFFSENSPEEKKQLDLFLPIKQIFKSADARKAYFDSVAVTKEPQMVTIPSVIIVGKTFKQREGSVKVIDEAVKYGYDTAASFARAFKALHGLTPVDVKQEGVKLKAYPKISFQISIKGEREMDYYPLLTREIQCDALERLGKSSCHPGGAGIPVPLPLAPAPLEMSHHDCYCTFPVLEV